MDRIEELRTDREAIRGRASKYSDAVNRYLSVAGYRSAPTHRPAPIATTTGLVLVGADDTPTSYTAVDHAAIEADLRGWHLRIVHARRTGGVLPRARDDGSRLLERLIDRVHAYSTTVPVTSRLVVGSPAPRLLAEARNAGLVVVGHRHGVTGEIFGVSVGERVAADHSGTVLVVRIPGWPPGPDFGQRPVVVGVDGDDSAAVRFAQEEARLRGSDLVLVHASRTPRVVRTEVVDGVTRHLRFVAESPADALAEASYQAAALVVERHGSSLPGSVSRALVQGAHCPVFVVG
ncbi:universal stress protein [Actinoplanes solisilvae]|uniref:universal stress protein n=1 Tax=Actinoplanes solisilvae TaxID=2486853 RepID=UPI0013E2B9DB|nr:universal stress protein [Actinoplanes solisilvae]